MQKESVGLPLSVVESQVVPIATSVTLKSINDVDVSQIVQVQNIEMLVRFVQAIKCLKDIVTERIDDHWQWDTARAILFGHNKQNKVRDINARSASY